MNALLITKAYWLNSQLSIVRFSYGCRINGHDYILLGREQDLVRSDIRKAYINHGREKIIQWIKEGKTEKEIKAIVAPKKTKVTQVEQTQKLFEV